MSTKNDTGRDFVWIPQETKLALHFRSDPSTKNEQIQSTFSQTHKIGNNANFVFSYIRSFFYYLYHMILVNTKIDIIWYKGIHYYIAAFTGFVNFECHSQNEVGNIGILILHRVCEMLF